MQNRSQTDALTRSQADPGRTPSRFALATAVVTAGADVTDGADGPGRAGGPGGAGGAGGPHGAGGARGAGGFRAEMDPEFSVAGKINGGYLLAVMVRAARAGLAASAPVGAGAGAGTAPPADAVEAGDGAGAGGSGGLQPVAATAHYLGAARPGPARVLVTVLHRGRSTGQVRAQLYQEQELFAEALVTFAGAGPVAARGWSDGPVVDLPPEEACFRMPVKAPGAPFEVPLMGVVDQRLDPSCLAFAMGRPPAWGSCAAGSVSRRNPPWMPSG